MLTSARAEIRGKFEESRALADPEAIWRLVAESRDAADFIRDYVVQAQLNERGNYAMKVQPHHAGTEVQDTVLDDGVGTPCEDGQGKGEAGGGT